MIDFNQNLLLYTPLLELLRHQNYEIIFETKDSLLIHDSFSNIYAGTCENDQEAHMLIQSIPKAAEEILLFQTCLFEEKLKQGILYDMISFNSVYLSKELRPVKLPISFTIAPLKADHVSFVMKHYSVKELCTEGHICERVAAGMLGIFHKDNLVGFIGTHLEGAMGMLEILPNYRHMGLGMALQNAMANTLLRQGAYVYGQVMQNNHASFALQKKCNFTVGNNPTYWYFQ